MLSVVLVSRLLSLELEGKLFISSIRCVSQLTLLAAILKPIFDSETPLYTVILTVVMILFGSLEVSLFKTRLTFPGLFPLVFACLFITNGTLALLGTAAILQTDPWYKPQELIPTFGMLLGNSCTSTALGLNTLLTHFEKDRDKIEMSMAFGATKWEAGKYCISSQELLK
jgi:ABC-type iron transport system FetAB permease component